MAVTQQDRAVIDLVINGQQAQTTLRDVTLAVSRTRAELLRMREADNPELYRARLTEQHRLIAAQREMSARINDTTTAYGRFKSAMAQVTMGVVGGNVITFALQQLMQFIPSTIDRVMKLKDSFANIEKATGLSAEGVKALNKELKQIDTRTTNAELRQIAVAGGQLGVANNELKDFVQNADMAVVALGDEFSGGVEQVAKELGGIGRLFTDTKNLKAGEQLKVIGSGLNELGAAGSATAPVIADFTTRMGALGGLAPKLAETLGLGAALQELGLSAEIGASGLTGVMTSASTHTDLFAQHLGMSTNALKDMINASPNDFLMALAKSFQGVAPLEVMARLKAMKVESQESGKVMMLLANQTDFVAEKQQLASKAMSEGTSLANEFAKKNHQLARDLKELNERFNSLFTSEAIQNFLTDAVHGAVEFLKTIPKVVDWLKQNRDGLYLLLAATVAYHGATVRATLATAANTVAEVARRVAFEVGYRWLILTEVATKAYALSTAVLTGQMTLQTAVVSVARATWASLTAVMAANPIGAIVVGITALAFAVKHYSDNTEAALRIERESIRLKRDLQLLQERHNHLLDQMSERMADYSTMSQAERAELVKTTALQRLDLESRVARLKVRERELEMLAAEPSLWQKLWESMKAGGNLPLMAVKLGLQSAENVRAVREQFNPAIQEAEAGIKRYDELFRQMSRVEQSEIKVTPGKLNTIADAGDKKRAADKKLADAKQEQEEFDKLMSEARQRASGAEATDYEKSALAFALKYARLYELAKGGEEQLNEIRRLSMLEWAGIEKKRGEQEVKAAEDRQKAVAENNKKLADAAIRHGELDRDTELFGIKKQEADGTITPDQSKQQQLDVEYQYLLGEFLMRQTFAQDTTEVYRRMNDNIIAQAEARRDKEKSIKDALKEQEWQLIAAKSEAFQQGVGALRGFFKESSVIYKALFLAEKAAAIAGVVINAQREISGLAANPFVLAMPPGVKEAYVTKSILMTKLRAGVAIGTIAAQTVQGLAAKAKGGYTDVQTLYGDPKGYVDGPTVFAQGPRSYLAGEAGREFVISNKALQVPAVADFARMLDAVQQSGNYSQFQPTARSGGAVAETGNQYLQSATDTSTQLLIAEVRAMRQQLQQQQQSTGTGERPVVMNYRLFEDYKDRVDEVRVKTRL